MSAQIEESIETSLGARWMRNRYGEHLTLLGDNRITMYFPRIPSSTRQGRQRHCRQQQCFFQPVRLQYIKHATVRQNRRL